MPQSHASLALLSIWIPWGSCQNAGSDSEDLGGSLRVCVYKKLPSDANGTGPQHRTCHSKGWQGLQDLTSALLLQHHLLPLPLPFSALAMLYFQFPARVMTNCWLFPMLHPLPEAHCQLLCFTMWIVIHALGPSGYHFLQEGSPDATTLPQRWNFSLTHLWIPRA